ncbi:MAG: hypothetical protein IAF38_08130 [Bacteroidia bacterium]|nr:hypothetical protein [Bacteroidia bacterium]
MKKKSFKLVLFSLGMCASIPFFCQQNGDAGSIHGFYQADAQYYFPDSLISAPTVAEKFLSNAFANINYTRGDFSAGLRYESYQNVMLGYPTGYKGSGIPYRYVRYKHKDLDFTAGNFYEQFGSGLIFRAYEARGLLFDNTIDGIRGIYKADKGFTFKGFVGKNRLFFGLAPGIVRGFDGEWNINEFNESLANKKTKVILGGSFVSKYQDDQNPSYVLPLNVGCYGGRATIIRGGFNFFAEGAYKINDPSTNNNYSYRDGKAAYVTLSYSGNDSGMVKKEGSDTKTKVCVGGYSFSIAGKMIDNMSYRSDRTAKLTAAMINFLPALTKPHTYLMMAYYPYATQPNGEAGGQAEFQYKARKGTPLGGHYGWELTVNGSVAYGTDTTNIVGPDPARYNYDIDYTNIGEEYFHDVNVEFNKKLSKKSKVTLMYSNQFYNKNIVQQNSPNAGFENIKTHIGVIDFTYKYKSGSAIRFEGQTMQTEQDKGSWAVGLVEWTITSSWFVTVLDQYNYGNKDATLQLHYPLVNLTYVSGPTRIVLQYGKQRAGIFCVGGVCRFVPASNGPSITISSSF